MKVVSINIVVFACLYVALCAIILMVFGNNLDNVRDDGYDSNTFRSTYPAYDEFNEEVALAIFEEYAAPETGYKPFIAYRRKPFEGEVVNIDQSGFRRSLNEAVDDSYWFLGGSTMWGTGASDETTIPSYFASLTGESVLNLGESGFTAFQELNNTLIMLMSGRRPKRVIFYDGVNDGYYNCIRGLELPSHAYATRYPEYIENYEALKSQAQQSRRKVISDASAGELIWTKLSASSNGLVRFLAVPYRYFVVTPTAPPGDFDASIPFSDIVSKQGLLECNDPLIAQGAAEILVESWLSAYVILESHGIEVYFFLQPAPTFEPHRYSFDYLINDRKQFIADNAASYRAFYDAVNRIWVEKCGEQGACARYFDLSSALFDLEEPLVIDESHISPTGNRLVANAIRQALSAP